MGPPPQNNLFLNTVELPILPTTYYLLPTTYYLLPTAYCLLPTAYCLLPTAYYLLPTTYYLLPTTYYLLPTTYYLLPTTYYLLPTTYYLLPTTYYLLPTTYYLLPTTYYLQYYLLPTTYYLQADLMMALVAVIRDLLCEFLSKSLGEKLRQKEISSFKSSALQKSCWSTLEYCDKPGVIYTNLSRKHHVTYRTNKLYAYILIRRCLGDPNGRMQRLTRALNGWQIEHGGWKGLSKAIYEHRGNFSKFTLAVF